MGARVQIGDGVNSPLPALKLMVPLGALAAPVFVSATVAMQVLGWPSATTAGVQLTVVEVDRVITATGLLPELATCPGSPP
jgi:hypothetical protein